MPRVAIWAWQHGHVNALPAYPPPAEDPLDPERILRELPERERENFLAVYREAVDGARDPSGWAYLRRVLRLWRYHAEATKDPGYWEAREAALRGTGGGMLLEDAVRLYRPAS
jgi:hypothetical protein